MFDFGNAHESAIEGLNVIAIETGIGYNGSYKNFRIFESYAMKHLQSGIEKNQQPSNYWFVIPNYYNVSEWTLNLKPKKRIGYFGRIGHIKGLNIFVEIAKRFPDIEFVMCGQGDPDLYLKESSNIVYQEPIHSEARSDFLGNLTALIAPSLYIEPFCGVNVEAQLCGTPVIASDFGAFVETIEPFKTGLLSHTLADYCYGVQMALNGIFDRQYIRERAIKLYGMYNVAYQYEYVFFNILDLANENNGWYSPYSYIKLLDDKNIINNYKVPFYYFYTPDYEDWNIHLTNTLKDHFDLKPTKTDKIPGLNDQHPIHHWTGSSYKIELVIDSIKKNIGKKIVFSDVTWYVNPDRVNELKDLVNFTIPNIMFANNSGDNTANIGFMVINCNGETLSIWEKALEIIKDNPNAHDQTIIMNLVANPSFFNSNKIVCRWPPSKEDWDKNYRNNFLMLKIFTPSDQNKISRDNFRIETMKEYGYDIFSNSNANK